MLTLIRSNLQTGLNFNHKDRTITISGYVLHLNSYTVWNNTCFIDFHWLHDGCIILARFNYQAMINRISNYFVYMLRINETENLVMHNYFDVISCFIEFKFDSFIEKLKLAFSYFLKYDLNYIFNLNMSRIRYCKKIEYRQNIKYFVYQIMH